MRKRLALGALVFLCLSQCGCSMNSSGGDIKKDALDPESLKAAENPPPGMPGPPPPGAPTRPPQKQ